MVRTSAKLRLLALPLAMSLVSAAGSGDSEEWVEIACAPKVKSGTALDFSCLADAPAGKYGFALNRNGQVAFERNPEPVRFVGANICRDVCFLPTKEAIDGLSDDFLRMGYNLVRFHHFEEELLTGGVGYMKPNPESLDRMDYTLAAMKRRGIYTIIDLYVNRDPNRYRGKGSDIDRMSYKALIWADEELEREFLDFAFVLLDHVNPYTGLKWKEEPAIIGVNLVNEDSVRDVWRGGKSAPVYQRLFGEWLKKKGIENPDPSATNRLKNAFLCDYYPPRYRKVAQKLRDFGVKQMLSDQNYDSGVVNSITREPYDYIENHFYVGHPTWVEKSWKFPSRVPVVSVKRRQMQFLLALGITQDIDRPFLVTEWDFVNPMSTAAEGGVLAGSYASLQDWDALCRFSWESRSKVVISGKGHPAWFHLATDPVRRLSEIAAVVLFRRRDVKPGIGRCPVPIRRSHYESEKIDAVYNTAIKGSREPDWPLRRNVLVSRTGFEIVPEDAPLKMPKRYFGPVYRSDTGELELDSKNSTFKAVSERSEAFVLEDGSSLTGKVATVTGDGTFHSVLVTSLDSRQTLETADSCLLLDLTQLKPTGIRFADKECSIQTSFGKLPLLLRKGSVKISMKKDLAGFKLYPLNLDGTRKSAVPFEVSKAGGMIELSTEIALAWELSRK